jgi:glycerol-3-phosphate acyltransferase PlsY
MLALQIDSTYLLKLAFCGTLCQPRNRSGLYVFLLAQPKPKGAQMQILYACLALPVAYLLGSIPVGVLVTRLVKGVEVTEIGSGRTGATNVYRAAGIWGLALTTLGDVLKGVFAVQLAHFATMLAQAVGPHSAGWSWVVPLAGIAVVAGHNWSVFLNFRGGAGTVTTVGVLAAMNPWIAAAVVLLGLIAMAISRMASVGSITLALAMAPALAVSAAIASTPWAWISFGIVAGAFTIYALLPNIRRILSGQERTLKLNH